MNSLKKTVLSVIAVLTLAFFSSTAQGQLKIGYVDYVRAMDSIPTYLKAINTLESYVQSSQKTLEDMAIELERAVKEFEDTKATMEPIILEMKMKNLEEQNQILMYKEQSFQQDLEIMKEKLLVPIDKSLKKAIEIVAVRNKVTYVLQYDPEYGSTGLLYVDKATALDLTNEVRAELIRIEAERTAPVTTGQ
jgi:outer membrane protein